MFTIYGIQGRRFRNILAQFRMIRKTSASQKASIRPNDTEQALENFAEQAADHPVSFKTCQA